MKISAVSPSPRAVPSRSVVAVSLLILAGLLLTACGGGGSTDADLVKALSTALRDDDSSDIEISQSTTDCMATEMVDSVGAEELATLGITADDASAINELGGSIISDTFNVDVWKCMSASEMAQLMSDGSSDLAAAECFVGEFGRDNLAEWMAAAEFTIPDGFEEASTACDFG